MSDVFDVKPTVTEHVVTQQPYGGFIAFWRTKDNPTWKLAAPGGRWNERVPYPCFETRVEALHALGKNNGAFVAKIVEIVL